MSILLIHYVNTLFNEFIIFECFCIIFYYCIEKIQFQQFHHLLLSRAQINVNVCSNDTSLILHYLVYFPPNFLRNINIFYFCICFKNVCSSVKKLLTQGSHKKSKFLVARPLRGRGGKDGSLKKTFFEARKKIRTKFCGH